MKASEPPRLAHALLRLVARENEPLVGDLVEEFQAGRTRGWFWRQVLRAVVHTPRRSSNAAPVPGLVLTGPRFDRAPGLALLDPATINLSGIKVQNVGGLGLIAIVILITIVLPEAWWLVLSGIVGGVVAGILMIVRRRARGLSGPMDQRPLALFRGDESEDGRTERSQAPRQGDIEQLVATAH